MNKLIFEKKIKVVVKLIFQITSMDHNAVFFMVML